MRINVDIFRQGDVLIVSIDEAEAKRLIADTKPVAREAGRIILAHGEVTGHAHAIVHKAAKLYEVQATAQQTILIVPVPARIYHEEHAAVTLKPGAYRIVRQREYSPQEIRRVAD